MSYVRQKHWTPKVVMIHLEEAAAIHRRLPDVRVAGYRTLWPSTLKDEWSRLYDSIHGKSKLGSPMPREVSYHEEMMESLRWVIPHEQRIIWMRANRIPWKSSKMNSEERGRRFGESSPLLWKRSRQSLTANTADPDVAATLQQQT